jgi:hypothetical protein
MCKKGNFRSHSPIIQSFRIGTSRSIDNEYMHLLIANIRRDKLKSIASDPLTNLFTSGQQFGVDAEHVARSLLLEAKD